MISLATTTVQIRMDSDLKKEAEEMFHRMGLTMTSAMNLFVKTAVDRRQIPFAITDMRSELENDLADARAHRNLSRAFSSPDEFFADLGI